MQVKLHSIITTINGPTEAIEKLVLRLHKTDAKLYVIGDKKGPASYPLEGVIFLSLQDQFDSQFELARRLPTDHYARKNIGYLTAIAQGASCIYETDDDNSPLSNWTIRHEEVKAKTVEERGQKAEDVAHGAWCMEHGAKGAEKSSWRKGPGTREQKAEDGEQKIEGRRLRSEIRGQKWVNVYKYFTEENVWPRGFPLDEIYSVLPLQAPSSDLHAQLRSPIQQGLVNNSPDVDAIWRLIFDRPFAFQQAPSVYLPPKCWCPFNSQSTWWWPIAYPLLYLPSYCSFRMTDIWRSFIAQRCLWELGHGVVFHGPEVTQERNAHNLMKDFEDEMSGYTRNKEFVTTLEKLNLDKGDRNVQKNLLKCYDELVKAEFFHKNELELVNTWLEDLERASS